jgi:small GTP-binding protein
MGEKILCLSHVRKVNGNICTPEALENILNAEKLRLGSIGANYEVHIQRLGELEKRLSQGRFHLAVLGQVKRGKSTFINALLGEEVLPSSVIPLTAIPTFIQYGEQRGLRIRYQDDRPDLVFNSHKEIDLLESSVFLSEVQWLNKHLMEFVAEASNPRNEKGVSHVEVTHPAPILRDVVVIDTPGIGSTYRHNTEMTINFLRQCDAALFVISADPPITEIELEFLKDIESKVSKIFFVLNKVDYLTKDELEKALAFYQEVLTQNMGLDGSNPIFAISARNALQAKESEDAQKWDQSGLERVSSYLTEFLAQEKSRVLKDAIAKKAYDILNDIFLQIELEIRALEMPITELESRLFLFENKLAEAEQQRIHAQDILEGDRKRVHKILEEYIKSRYGPFCEQLTEVAEKAIESSPLDSEQAAQQAVANIIPKWFEQEFATVSDMIDKEIATRLKIQEQRIDELIESIRKAATELFEIPYHTPVGERVYEIIREPYFVEQEEGSLLIPISPDFIERVMPGKMRKKRIKERLHVQIEKLVLRNLENIRWETLLNIDGTFRKFTLLLDNDFSMTIKSTHGAISSTLAQRKMNEETFTDQVNQLKKTAVEVRNVIQMFEYKGTGHRRDV